MNDLHSTRTLLRYSDWANDRVLAATSHLADTKLDQPIEMGRRSLRSELLHILAGESVWLQRWQGRRDTPGPNENEPAAVATIADRIRRVYADRDGFLASATPADLAKHVVYRDSKGSLFSATLGDMMIQMCVHSTHHRAQCVNMIRRLGGAPPELDYIMWIRRPATD